MGKDKKILSKLSSVMGSVIPVYSRIPLILTVAVNMAVYLGARLIAGDWYHYNMETAFDRMIPFWPPSAAIYLGCYIFWAVNYILIARQEKRKVCQFFAGDVLSRLICLAFFLLIPTTNIRPAVDSTGVWNQVMRLIYAVDAPDNLFPSIHCLVSWFCYIGIRDCRGISAGYRGFSGIMAVLVCISTLLTKQHVIADVAGGILLAEICFRIGKCPAVSRFYGKQIDRINRAIFGSREEDGHAEQKKSAV
ncbi:MAG: phosphatase PAP2 family protein [Lachnospiraceae bacterium]|nr:phosphatase PAP2 family protein [Lachnospiraceae bacterium]